MKIRVGKNLKAEVDKRKKSNAPTPYSPFGPPMPRSWTSPYVIFHPYQSWEWSDSRARYPYYPEPSRQNHAAPSRPADQQSHVNGHFSQTKPVQSSWKKKEVVKQVYRVKRDGRQRAVSGLTQIDKEPAESALATKVKAVKRVSFKDPLVESEQVRLIVPEVRENLPLCKTKPQPGCILGLTYWQKRNLQRLSAEELKARGMAWVPNGRPQGNSDVQTHVVRKTAGVRKEKQVSKRSDRRVSSFRRELQPIHNPYYPAFPLMPMPWIAYPGTTGYPPWAYFDPWVQHHGMADTYLWP